MTGPGALLALLRNGRRLTRSQLIAESGLARATVAHRLQRLLDAGYVQAMGNPQSTGGRPAEVLTLCADRGILLVADIGSSHARFAAADLDGRLSEIRDLDIEIDRGPQIVLARAEEIFDEILRATGRHPAEVHGLAFGVPGPVEQPTGRLVSPPTMPGWDGVDVAARFGGRFASPIAVDKDANIMALGVHRELGAGADDALVVKMGMGIGAGVISRGRILRGAWGAAGDLGHIPRPEGPLCRCGQQGCAEASAGGWAIARRLREAGRTQVRTSRDVVALAREHDAQALTLLREAGRRVGETVVDAIGVLNPSLVVIGGDLAEAGEMLMAGMRETVYQRSHPLATKDLTITTSPLGADAGLIGAAHLAADVALAPGHVDRLLATFD